MHRNMADQRNPQPQMRSNEPLPLAEARRRAAPMDRASGIAELGLCLTLCAPSGMSEDERYLWLEAAWPEVEYMPATVLSTACAEARRVVDHPAKLIPAIIRFGAERAEKLRDALRHEVALWDNRNARRLTAQAEVEQTDEDRAEVAGMIRELRRKMAASALKGVA